MRIEPKVEEEEEEEAGGERENWWKTERRVVRDWWPWRWRRRVPGCRVEKVRWMYLTFGDLSHCEMEKCRIELTCLVQLTKTMHFAFKCVLIKLHSMSSFRWRGTMV